METPYYLYDGDMITARCAELSHAFSAQKCDLFYAVKANDHPAVITIAAAHGIGACLVSAGEMKRAMAGGIKPSSMLMNGVGKSDEDIKFALENDIGQLNVESLPELHKIAQISEGLNVKARICVRINPVIAAQTHSHTATGRKEDKFGILVEDLPEAAAIIASHPALDWRGLSCHIGSQIHGTEELAASYRFMTDLFAQWRTKMPSFDRLDLGGGFGVSYTGDSYARPDDYADLIAKTCGDLMASGVTIQLEPGRFIAAEAGTLVTKVLYIKNSGDIRFVIVDAGMNNLLRPALYNAYHPITLARESHASMTKTTIAGPVCESADVFATDRDLPDDVAAGDLLHIGCAGAYGAAMSSQYNARGRLAEYIKTGENVQMIRRPFSADELDRLTIL